MIKSNMKLAVYDTYAFSKKGDIIHFDVLLPSGENKEKALIYANTFLKKISEEGASLKIDRCNYCHIESAKPSVKKLVEADGHYILQMEGCPNPK